MRDNTVSPFERLTVWQSALAFVKHVYALTALYPANERYALCTQTQRAIVSVVANIGEGSCRHGSKAFAHFCQVAYGSLRECEILLIVASELGYITAEQLRHARAELSGISRQLFRLTQSLQRAHSNAPVGHHSPDIPQLPSELVH